MTLIINPQKRCAMCKISRQEGAVIRRGQGYCNSCMVVYRTSDSETLKKLGVNQHGGSPQLKIKLYGGAKKKRELHLERADWLRLFWEIYRWHRTNGESGISPSWLIELLYVNGIDDNTFEDEALPAELQLLLDGDRR